MVGTARCAVPVAERSVRRRSHISLIALLSHSTTTHFFIIAPARYVTGTIQSE